MVSYFVTPRSQFRRTFPRVPFLEAFSRDKKELKIYKSFFFEIGSALRKFSGPMGPDRLSYREPVLLAEKHSAETPLLRGGYYSAKSMNIPQQQDPHYRGSS